MMMMMTLPCTPVWFHTFLLHLIQYCTTGTLTSHYAIICTRYWSWFTTCWRTCCTTCGEYLTLNRTAPYICEHSQLCNLDFMIAGIITISFSFSPVFSTLTSSFNTSSQSITGTCATYGCITP